MFIAGHQEAADEAVEEAELASAAVTA